MKKTPQEYIDETVCWQDGTPTNFTPLTAMQWRIWLLATAGKFFEGMIIFMGGIALPLIHKEFILNNIEKGLVTASGLLGILIGASLIGGLADKHGRKTLFIFEIALLLIFLIVTMSATNFPMLLIGLIGMGLALGCDYPTAHIIISENIPSSMRGKLVLGAFAFQSIGIVTGSLVGYLVLVYNMDNIEAWRYMYAIGIIPALIVFIARFTIPESATFLASHNQFDKAEKALERLLARHPKHPLEIKLTNPESKKKQQHRIQGKGTYSHLFDGKHRRATLLASIPWFLQDLGTYGLGIFTPVILAEVIGSKIGISNVSDIIHNDIIGVKGTIFVDLFVIIGVIGAIFLADKIGRIKLQVFGFIGVAFALLLVMASIRTDGSYNMTLLFVGFILFNFLNNLGPNAQTYLLSGEVFSTKLRARGAGFAASFAKVGAVLTAFIFPILLSSWGVTVILMMLIFTSLIGAAVTHYLRIETRKSLDDM